MDGGYPCRQAQCIDAPRGDLGTPQMTYKRALKYCRETPDARESGADDEHLISVEACAKRIVTTLPE